MGRSMDYDNAKKPRSDQQQQQQRRSRAVVLLLVLTNLASILVFSGAGAALHAHVGRRYPALHAWGSSKLLRELNATGLALAASHAEVVDLSSRLSAANKQLEAILGGSAAKREAGAPSRRRAAAGPHRLPLGPSQRLGAESEMFPALGQACHRHRGELEQYMNYTAGGECPSDEAFAQRLMLKGCEPLPRRRCRPRTPAGYVEPTPLPASLWAIPPDTSIVWDAYTCKNYSCLVSRGRAKGSYDCKDCFDLGLGGREKDRWMRRGGKDDGDDRGSLDYTIDGVLAAVPRGTVRIGLDIGGGSGTFAARMRERGVTVVTTTMNFDGPFNSFVASRGLVPMHVSVAARLPFFDGTLDLVHSMHVLSSWIPDAVLELALFDVYRVLRPGGVFWLDHFFCLGAQLDATYLPMFERIGFEKLRWNACWCQAASSISHLFKSRIFTDYCLLKPLRAHSQGVGFGWGTTCSFEEQ
ncbi:probable methyltransferase At1g29790 [Panicum virgatum]|uniref:probable methyltransferase At1g29790 n=1 Tax=Panicum virgatum TaxID=38727 RepID=UPI0019D5B089|nr:probable methyltransferase At1g29790 [Panicum virgatum]